MEKIKIIKDGKEEIIEVDKAELTHDGFHTFKELYEHRMILSAIAFRYAKEKGWCVWKSKKHFGEDKPIFGGDWFIVGVTRPDGKQYSYHYKMKFWDLFDFAKELEHSPQWDGHKPEDIDRLLPLIGWTEE